MKVADKKNLTEDEIDSDIRRKIIGSKLYMNLSNSIRW